MKVFFVFISFPFLFLLFLNPSVSSETRKQEERARFPPRGWNTYDSFSWIISEKEFLQNAEMVAKRLRPHGYEYVVVDYLWYRKKVDGAWQDSAGIDVIDEWGRVIPDPERWPSSRGGKGFSEVAKKVHDMGLKFGIHLMRGISTQAVNANTPILDTTTGHAYEEGGRKWTAKDVGIRERACVWMEHGFMSVDTSLGAGRAFTRSLYEQYAEWGVDFVKNDCVFGENLDIDEITYVSEVLKQLDRPILYSLSPGSGVTAEMAKKVSGMVNMYRITGDDWDTWADIVTHFNISRDMSTAGLIGTKGLLGKSWPDLDMLPLGWLTDPGANVSSFRRCNLTLDEQKIQMTLWSMAKSPLMFGGDVRKLDERTYSLITNPTLLEINSYSSNNMEFPFITSKTTVSESTDDVLASKLTSLTDVLGLTSCTNSKAIGWSIEALDQDQEKVCWKQKLQSKHQPPFCLNKRQSVLPSDESMTSKQKYQGKHHLTPTDIKDFCLGASSNKKLTSKERKSGALSPCKWHTNQMWELTANGTLENTYSGLCATVNDVKAKVSSGGARSWIATGRDGEIYVAFFNLNPEKTVISARISDVAKVLPGKNLNGASCKCKEVWTGKEIAVKDQTISVAVKSHGPALLILNCN